RIRVVCVDVTDAAQLGGFLHALVEQCRLPAAFGSNDLVSPAVATLSLHDALPISRLAAVAPPLPRRVGATSPGAGEVAPTRRGRSEEHTSELQSQSKLVCRLMLEKKNKTIPVQCRSKSTARESTHQYFQQPSLSQP